MERDFHLYFPQSQNQNQRKNEDFFLIFKNNAHKI